MEDLKKLINKQEFLFELLGKGDVTVNEKENGVMISFKEIYDEVKKTSTQIDSISKRLEIVEKKIDSQENNKSQFWRNLSIGLLVALVPTIIAIFTFAAKGGAF